MTESSGDITKLCESWWGQMADNTKADQHRFADQLLGLLGWHDPAPMGAKTRSAQISSASYILRGNAQTPVAAHFVMPGSLEPPSFLVERGLDFCETTRLIVNEIRALNVNYVFVTDLHRSYLYDTHTDELLLHADSPAEFRRDMADVLSRAGVERGSFEEIRRQPRSHVAGQLRRWCERWQDIVAAETKAPEEAAFMAVDRLLILRYLLSHDILKRPGWRLRQRFKDLASQAFRGDAEGCGKRALGFFHDIWLDWRGDVFKPFPALETIFEKDSITTPLIKEFVLLSNTKFSIATILESFNYGEAAEKARVRMVPGENEERDTYLSKRTLDNLEETHIELDLADEGYRAIFQWLDRLTALYGRLETEFDARSRQTGPAQEALDLFAWSEIDAKRPEAFGHKLDYAIENGITFYHSSPRQLRTARLMLHLHVINYYNETRQRFIRFPPMAGAFEERGAGGRE